MYIISYICPITYSTITTIGGHLSRLLVIFNRKWYPALFIFPADHHLSPSISCPFSVRLYPALANSCSLVP